MNEEIHQEMVLLMNIYEVSANEQIKILALCSKILDSKKYVDKIKETLDNVFNGESFNFINEFSRLLLGIINVNKQVEMVKEVKEDRIKFLLYSILYSYLSKNQKNLLNATPLGDLRLLFCNSIELILLIPQTIKISKENCCLFSCFNGNNRIKI